MTEDFILTVLCLIAIDLAILGLIILEGFNKVTREQRINKHDSQQIKVRLNTLKRILHKK